MKALVTGGTGFVGSHLLEALAGRGLDTRALVRSPRKAEALGIGGVQWIAGDLREVELLRGAAEGVDLIFHVAGLIAARSAAEYHEVNVEGTARLLAAAAATGARFVFVSSLAAGGPSTPGRPLRGDEAPRPVTRYGRSKLAAEEVVRSGPLPWTILRPPAVYGPRDRELLRVFRAARLGVAPVFGTGDQELSFIYGPDLAEALIEAALAPAAAGGVFYPAHPELVTQVAFSRAVGAAVGRRVRVIRIPVSVARVALAVTGAAARLVNRATVLEPDKGNEFFEPAWGCDPSRFEAVTGWRARHDLATGTARTAAWYRESGWLWR